MVLLLLNALGQMRQISYSAVDLALRGFEVAAAHQRCGARQPPTGTIGDREHHRQIPQQFFG